MIHQEGNEKQRQPIAAADHEQAMAAILAKLTHADGGKRSAEEPIGAVGHRVVHGGEEFTGSVLIDDAVIASIEKTAQLAPLHNPPNLTGIRAAMHALAQCSAGRLLRYRVSLNDSAKWRTRTHLPYEIYEKTRRAALWVSRHFASLRGPPSGRNPGPPQVRHQLHYLPPRQRQLDGRRASEGHSIDTSMGLTPLEGLVMGTRCGDIDPAILFYLADNGYDS